MIVDRKNWTRVKKEGVIKWCEDLGLSHASLQYVDRSVDSVYKIIKLELMLDGKLIELDAPLNYVQLPLCEVLIAGYFHNTGEKHDDKFLKAGYSMLTSANINWPLCAEKTDDLFVNAEPKHDHLPKLELADRSTLTKLGDTVQNTYLIFTNLFKVVSTGRVFMKQACRVSADMIIKNSNTSWQRKCRIESVEDLSLRTLVTRKFLEFIGPKICYEVLKTDKKYIKNIEEESGAKIYFMFDHCQIGIFGSVCEVKNVLQKTTLISDVVDKPR